MPKVMILTKGAVGVVLEANVAMSIVKQEAQGLAVKGLILEGEDVFAPDLFKLEVANGFWKYVHAGYLDKTNAQKFYHAACNLVTRYVRQNDLVTEVLQEAARLGHPVCDIAYVVLARRMGASLATLDRKLMDLCKRAGVDCVGATIL